MYHGWVPLSEHTLLIELGIILHSDLFGHNVKFQSDVCNTGHTVCCVMFLTFQLIELINVCVPDNFICTITIAAVKS